MRAKQLTCGLALVIAAALALWPAYSGFARLSMLVAWATLFTVVVQLAVALIVGSPTRSILFWGLCAVGFALSVNAENGQMLTWATQWLVAAVAALAARRAAEELSWTFNRTTVDTTQE